MGLELAGVALTLRRAALDPALAPGLGLAALALPVLAPLALELPSEPQETMATTHLPQCALPPMIANVFQE